MTDAERRDAHTLVGVAALCDEAAAILRQLPEDLAETLQVRHWLPDELEGSALLLRDHALRLRGVPDDCLELFQ